MIPPQYICILVVMVVTVVVAVFTLESRPDICVGFLTFVLVNPSDAEASRGHKLSRYLKKDPEEIPQTQFTKMCN